MTRSIMSVKAFFCLVFALLCQFSLADEIQPVSTKLTVYHQKDGNYIKRGEIIGLPGVPEYVPYEHEIVNFKDSKDVFYQIKVKDEQSGKVILQSVKMCQMVASDWSDEFILHLDENNKFYYVSYYAGSDDCDDKLQYPITTKPFTSTVKVVKPAPAPQPLIGNFATQKAQTASKKPTVQVNDEIPDVKEIEEKSFFQKYWYFILGGVVLLLTANGPPPPEAAAPARR